MFFSIPTRNGLGEKFVSFWKTDQLLTKLEHLAFSTSHIFVGTTTSTSGDSIFRIHKLIIDFRMPSRRPELRQYSWLHTEIDPPPSLPIPTNILRQLNRHRQLARLFSCGILGAGFVCYSGQTLNLDDPFVRCWRIKNMHGPNCGNCKRKMWNTNGLLLLPITFADKPTFQSHNQNKNICGHGLVEWLVDRDVWYWQSPTTYTRSLNVYTVNSRLTDWWTREGTDAIVWRKNLSNYRRAKRADPLGLFLVVVIIWQNYLWVIGFH